MHHAYVCTDSATDSQLIGAPCARAVKHRSTALQLGDKTLCALTDDGIRYGKDHDISVGNQAPGEVSSRY
jgi:hypothetical protein